jgi:hypothetical protein
MNYLVESGGPFAGGIVNLEEHADYESKIFFVSNETGSTKVVEGHTLLNGQFAIFFWAGAAWRVINGHLNTDSLPEGSSNLYYDTSLFAADFAAAFAGAFASEFTTAVAALDTDDIAESATKHYVTKSTGSFEAHLYDSANTDLDDGTATWEIIDGLVHLTLPFLAGAAAAGGVRVTAASDAAIPADIQSIGPTWCPAVVEDSGTIKTEPGLVDDSTNKILFDNGIAGGGLVKIFSQTLVYKV